ncbi:hypothetical protein [Xanthomonas albilineans]|uniref:hypothetical protein n=1 Tax=Xanthomonas albilineans TaxID=29447 RepID=UPI00280AFD06|nr:hypothetical protein [Xanthomonas albilineans]
MNAIPVETPHAAARRILGHFLAEGYLPTGLHEYRDAQGNPVFWRARCKHPDGRKEIRPFRWNGTRYVPGEPPAPPEGKVLYQLPELLAANVEAIVYVAEGEACADALTALGLLATTSGSSSSAGGQTGRHCAVVGCACGPTTTRRGASMSSMWPSACARWAARWR